MVDLLCPVLLAVGSSPLREGPNTCLGGLVVLRRDPGGPLGAGHAAARERVPGAPRPRRADADGLLFASRGVPPQASCGDAVEVEPLPTSPASRGPCPVHAHPAVLGGRDLSRRQAA
jgi:hypothetical protein